MSPIIIHRPEDDGLPGTEPASETSPLLRPHSHPGGGDLAARRQVTHSAEEEEGGVAAPGHGDDDDHYNGALQIELWLLLEYSLPLIATYLLQYSHAVATTFVAGHLGADALAAGSVANITLTIVLYTIIEGMATALDTLCAQAYGSGNLRGVGLYVQRMMLLMAVVSVPITAFCWFSPYILAAVLPSSSPGSSADLAGLAGSFLRVSVLGLPGYMAWECGKRFLQAQGSFGPATAVIMISAPLNAVLCWTCAFNLGLGLPGAALGNALTSTLRPLLLMLYVVSPWGAWSHVCWGGLSWEAFEKWGPPVGLSFAGSVVNLGEWSSVEILGISTSYLGTHYLAAQSLLMTLINLAWHIPFSVSVAITTRIGHLIGAGQVRAARRLFALYAGVLLFVGVVNGAVMFGFRGPLLRFFMGDQNGGREVLAIARRVIPFTAVFCVTDALICACNGVLRGLGRQGVAGWVVFAVNLLLSVPLGLWLELGAPHLEVGGIWIGLGAGQVIIVAVECVYMRLLDWQGCADRAKEREQMSNGEEIPTM